MRSFTRSTLFLALALLLHLPVFAQGGPVSTSGNGLQFDGIDDYVDLGSWSPGTSWTIQTWVNVSSIQDGRRALVGGFNACADWGLVIVGGQFGVAYRPTGGDPCTATLLSGVSAVPGERYHVAATKTGSSLKIYINGDLRNVTTNVDASYSGTTGGTRIGSSSCCGEFFNGVIDEVSVWNRARSKEEMQCAPHLKLAEADFSTGGGCVAYYTFNSISNSTVSDLSGHEHNGTVNGPTPALSRIALGTDCGGVVVGDPGVYDLPVVGGSIEMPVDPWNNNNLPFDLATTLVLAAPEGTQPPGTNTGNDRYWIIEAFGPAAIFSANLTVGIGTPFPSGPPSTVALYTRPGTSIGPWTFVAEAVASNANAHTVTFNGLTHFSQYIARVGDSRLPVELASFDVSLAQDKVLLSWRTASEVNNAGFEVQRAREVSGGSPDFRAIASFHSNPELTGLGTSSHGQTYSFTDPRNQLEPGATYLYRIVDVTTDGIRAEHPAKSVHIDEGGTLVPVSTFKVSTIAPNPARDVAVVSFELPEPADVTIQLFAENGARCAIPVPSKHYQEGENSESVSLVGFPSGSYTLVVTTGTQSRERRFTIVR